MRNSLVRLVVISSRRRRRSAGSARTKPPARRGRSEIIAKAVPPRRVETDPNTMPKERPATPPTSGISGSGIGIEYFVTVFIACTDEEAARRINRVSDDSIPAWPRACCRESRKMMEMPIRLQQREGEARSEYFGASQQQRRQHDPTP